MKINEIIYGCNEHHCSLNGFQRIEKIIKKTCGHIEVTGTCCKHGNRFTKEYCERCLR